MSTERPSAFERERRLVEVIGHDPDSAAAMTSGCSMGGARLRDRESWDEGGPGAEVETTPAHCTDGWGWLQASSEEWDRIEAACRPFKAGYLDALRGEARKSTHVGYLAGYDAYKEQR